MSRYIQVDVDLAEIDTDDLAAELARRCGSKSFGTRERAIIKEAIEEYLGVPKPPEETLEDSLKDDCYKQNRHKVTSVQLQKYFDSL